MGAWSGKTAGPLDQFLTVIKQKKCQISLQANYGRKGLGALDQNLQKFNKGRSGCILGLWLAI